MSGVRTVRDRFGETVEESSAMQPEPAPADADGDGNG